jgi:hypothetical protein
MGLGGRRFDKQANISRQKADAHSVVDVDSLTYAQAHRAVSNCTLAWVKVKHHIHWWTEKLVLKVGQFNNDFKPILVSGGVGESERGSRLPASRDEKKWDRFKIFSCPSEIVCYHPPQIRRASSATRRQQATSESTYVWSRKF